MKLLQDLLLGSGSEIHTQLAAAVGRATAHLEPTTQQQASASSTPATAAAQVMAACEALHALGPHMCRQYSYSWWLLVLAEQLAWEERLRKRSSAATAGKAAGAQQLGGEAAAAALPAGVGEEEGGQAVSGVEAGAEEEDPVDEEEEQEEAPDSQPAPADAIDNIPLPTDPVGALYFASWGLSALVRPLKKDAKLSALLAPLLGPDTEPPDNAYLPEGMKKTPLRSANQPVVAYLQLMVELLQEMAIAAFVYLHRHHTYHRWRQKLQSSRLLWERWCSMLAEVGDVSIEPAAGAGALPEPERGPGAEALPQQGAGAEALPGKEAPLEWRQLQGPFTDRILRAYQRLMLTQAKLQANQRQAAQMALRKELQAYDVRAGQAEARSAQAQARPPKKVAKRKKKEGDGAAEAGGAAEASGEAPASSSAGLPQGQAVGPDAAYSQEQLVLEVADSAAGRELSPLVMRLAAYTVADAAHFLPAHVTLPEHLAVTCGSLQGSFCVATRLQGTQATILVEGETMRKNLKQFRKAAQENMDVPAQRKGLPDIYLRGSKLTLEKWQSSVGLTHLVAAVRQRQLNLEDQEGT